MFMLSFYQGRGATSAPAGPPVRGWGGDHPLLVHISKNPIWNNRHHVNNVKGSLMRRIIRKFGGNLLSRRPAN